MTDGSSIFSFAPEYFEHLVLEDGFQLFQLQGQGDVEHAFVAIERAVCR